MMETPTQISLIIAGAIVALAIIFYRPISKRIESGSGFEASIAPTGARIVVAPSDKHMLITKDAASQVLEQTSVVANSPDVRLLYLDPFPDSLRYRTLELPNRQPLKLYNYPAAPTGTFVVGQVPFFFLPVADESGKLIGHHAIDILPSEKNEEAIEEVPAFIAGAVAVHFLISAGNGWAIWDDVQFMGRRIGQIELVFADKSKQLVELILGKNIREWAFGNHPNLVRDIEYGMTKPAWVSFDNTRRIDMMSVPIDGGPKELASIRVIAKFEVEELAKPIALPATIISAITCEKHL